jgi:hypothetical protein
MHVQATPVLGERVRHASPAPVVWTGTPAEIGPPDRALGRTGLLLPLTRYGHRGIIGRGVDPSTRLVHLLATRRVRLRRAECVGSRRGAAGHSQRRSTALTSLELRGSSRPDLRCRRVRAGQHMIRFSLTQQRSTALNRPERLRIAAAQRLFGCRGATTGSVAVPCEGVQKGSRERSTLPDFGSARERAAAFVPASQSAPASWPTVYSPIARGSRWGSGG